ncbi:murein hydrolase activator EnvC family protein [Bacillus sp. CGMCC 1.16607]|uniref:murein hydrolase activator EnvC family protein n=1 Tax=Bacillus sp. CGMCC 1.16607 TaxID=3351842 RepID=UPI0036311E31
MKRPLNILLIAVMIGIGSLLAGTPLDKAFASKLSDLKGQKNQITNERNDLESEIDKANDEIDRLQGEQSKVRDEIKRLDLAVNDTEDKIREKNKQIEDTNKEIEQLKIEIKELEERIAKRNELLKDRARNFQETGGMVSYIDVLMGAKSFGDFIDRVSAVATIVEADQDILRKHTEDKELLEKKKTEVETKLANLEKMLKDLESMKVKLNAQKADKDKLMASLKMQEHEMHELVLNKQERNELLAAQELAIKKAIELEKARLAELERQRQEAAKNGGSTDSTPPVTDGSFMKPANGRFSSGFGHRWGENHFGIDIANRSDVPIVAAADGVVIKSYYSRSYGNAIFISHSINGQIYTTVYAHMSSRIVGTGAVVSKGQQIGVMGNTGYSTGQHLHFEIHKGPWNDAKSNAVNPLNYISM